MAWTVPMTAVERDVWTSTQFNTHVRDNELELMVAKAATAGGYYVTSAVNSLVERGAASAVVLTAEARANIAYGDLTTAGPAVTVTTGTKALVFISCEMSSDTGPSAPLVTATTTYASTGTATFQADGTNRSDGTRMYQGYFDSTNGNQFSMSLMPYATMQSDMAGADVTLCELYLDNTHFYSFGGGYAIIGTHNQTSLAGSHVVSQVTQARDQEFYTYGQAKYVTVPNSIAEDIRDNTMKGIALGKGPTSALSYYGYFVGGTSPKLRVTYTKPGTSGGYCLVSFAVSGATTVAANDKYGIYMSGVTANNSNRYGVGHLVTGLIAGSNTFTMKYAAGTTGATGAFSRREIVVLPL